MPFIGLIKQDSLILIISRVPCLSRDDLGHLSAPDQQAKTKTSSKPIVLLPRRHLSYNSQLGNSPSSNV